MITHISLHSDKLRKFDISINTYALMPAKWNCVFVYDSEIE